MFSFEVRRNLKIPNGVKLNALQNCYHRFLCFSILTPKIHNFNFSKIIAYKIQNFWVIQKKWMYVIEKHTKNAQTKFQSNMFVFGCAIAQKQKKVMMSHFEMQFVAFVIVVHKNKWHFLESWGKTAQDRYRYFGKKILNFEIWPNLT